MVSDRECRGIDRVENSFDAVVERCLVHREGVGPALARIRVDVVLTPDDRAIGIGHPMDAVEDQIRSRDPDGIGNRRADVGLIGSQRRGGPSRRHYGPPGAEEGLSVGRRTRRELQGLIPECIEIEVLNGGPSTSGSPDTESNLVPSGGESVGDRIGTGIGGTVWERLVRGRRNWNPVPLARIRVDEELCRNDVEGIGIRAAEIHLHGGAGTVGSVGDI